MKVGGFSQNLNSTFMQFGRIDGYDITVIGMTMPKTPNQISIIAQIHEFNEQGVRTTVSTAENKLNVMFGRSVNVKKPASAAVELSATEPEVAAPKLVDQEKKSISLKLDCSAG